MPSVISILTQPDIDGTYRVTLEIDADTSYNLDRCTAQTHATAILAAVARAEHDAAVIRQMRKVGTGREAAVELITTIRADRPAIDWPAPLQLTPGVSSKTGDPFLHVTIKRKAIGQWTMDDARNHAMSVLEAVEVADLDGAYLRALMTIGVDEPRARATVGNLADFRDD